MRDPSFLSAVWAITGERENERIQEWLASILLPLPFSRSPAKKSDALNNDR
jgi:hypothetical protein